jgi:MFS family permease
MRDRGELADHVAKLAVDKCPKSNILLIAAPIGAAVGLILGSLIGWLFGGQWHRPSSPNVASAAQWIVFACAAYYVVIGAALHFLEPEYDPRYRFMSEYAWSSHGWLMTTTFFVLALALLTVALALRNLDGPSRSARVGFGLLVVGAAGICVAGVFRGFPLHDVGGAVGLPSVVMAALFLSWSFRSAPGWRPFFLITLIALGMFTALLSMVIDVGMPGLQQRIFLSLVLLWLAIVAHRLVRVTARPV